ncbi:MAG: hypothetical protein K6E50_01785 [Lachnospiraceae bacterium]|nr:hypothetical protein [Lachnospiraceae bacterium]
MNPCPNCGAEMTFDIASQMLKCPFCEGTVAPTAAAAGKAAEESHYVEYSEAPKEDGIAMDVTPQMSAQPQMQPAGQVPPAGMQQQSYAQPQQLGPSPSQQSYGMPQQTNVMPTQTFGAVVPPVGGQQQAYGTAPQQLGPSPSKQSYGMPPQQGMGMPQQGYGMPQQGYAMPQQQAYAQPQQPNGMQMAYGAVEPPAGVAPQMAGTAPQQQSFEGQQGTAETQPDAFDVISYTCPQCGGSIYATEESVNGFCSYCGSNLMLQSRMGKMPRPKKIIPFSIDKQKCKAAYQNYTAKALFAPKEFKDPNALERFRGIYMPYWVYDSGLNQQVNLRGKKSYRRGNYVYTEHYKCSAYVDCFYRGLTFDASASFDDYFSRGIAPFDVRAMVDFNENYMSGFYADMQDVDYRVYMADAMNFSQKQIFAGISSARCFPGVTISDDESKTIHPMLEGGSAYLAFQPVWFLSYRKKDRVAYAVVNGQTGKIVSDLPVDNKKVLLSAGLIALVLYAIMAFLPAMTPVVLLGTTQFISLVSVGMLLATLSKVIKREKRLDDKGYLSKYDLKNYKAKEVKDNSGKKATAGVLSAIGVVAVVGLQFGVQIAAVIISLVGAKLLALIAAATMVIMTFIGFSKAGEGPKETKTGLQLGLAAILGATAFATLLHIFRPPSDLLFYGGTFVMMAGTIICQLLSLKQYNLLTTHPLPQLNRKGGDDSAPV